MRAIRALTAEEAATLRTYGATVVEIPRRNGKRSMLNAISEPEAARDALGFTEADYSKGQVAAAAAQAKRDRKNAKRLRDAQHGVPA